jgi:hypothetical protein
MAQYAACQPWAQHGTSLGLSERYLLEAGLRFAARPGAPNQA